MNFINKVDSEKNYQTLMKVEMYEFMNTYRASYIEMWDSKWL